MVRERFEPIEIASKHNYSPFIGIIVCPDYHSSYKSDMLNGYGLNKTKYINGRYFPLKDLNGRSASMIFQSVTHDVDDILQQIDVLTRSGWKSAFVINFEKNNYSEQIDVEIKYWPSFGRCYSLKLKQHILDQGINFIAFTSHVGIYIYLTYPGQFTHPNSKTKVIKLLMFLNCIFECND